MNEVPEIQEIYTHRVYAKGRKRGNYEPNG